MLTVPEALVAALQTGSQVVTVTVKAELWRDGTPLADLAVVGGSVELDRMAASRRTLSLTIPAEGGFAPTMAQALTWYNAGTIDADETHGYVGGWLKPQMPWVIDALRPGGEIRVSWWWSLPSGDSGHVTLGRFRIGERTAVDGADGGVTIDITGEDLSRSIARNLWTSRYLVPDGTNIITALRNIVTDRWTGGTAPQFAWDDMTDETAKLVFGPDDDPWAAAMELAADHGADLYFDEDGVVQIRRDDAIVYGSPVFTLDDGYQGTATSVSLGVSDATFVNGVIFTATNAASKKSIRVIEWDNDPASEVAVSRVGYYPMVVERKSVKTRTAARRAARRALRRNRGYTAAVEVSTWPVPFLEPGDVVGVSSSALGLDEHFVIERMTVPLDLSEMTVTASRRLT